MGASIPIGLLSTMITPALMERVKKRLDLDDEKLTLMLVRLLNPDEILGEAEEAKLRGVSAPTLRGMKERGDLPKHVNGY